jgi:ClpP class serine protease
VASGGYYIAAAVDKIFVSNASVIGSIGVIMGSFGFVDTMKKARRRAPHHDGGRAQGPARSFRTG